MSKFKTKLSPDEIPKKIQYEQLPDDIKLKSSEMFCPLCGHVSEWKLDTRINAKKCPYCGLSENDYYVRRINQKWGESKEEKRKRLADKRDERKKKD